MALVLLAPAASAGAGEETILDERAWTRHCIALRSHPKTPPGVLRAYCRCMPGVIGGLTRFSDFDALVRTWPISDRHCRRRAGLR